MLVKINSTSLQWPYTLQMLHKDNPQVSFPLIPSEALLNEYGVYTVLVDQKPELNETKTAIRLDPVLESGKYVQHWQLIDLNQ